MPCHSFSGRPRSLHKLVPTACSIKASAGEKLSSYLHNLTGQILDASPEAIKEFPWVKAKLIVEERLLVLGKNALTWSLVALLVFSFVCDALTAFFVRRELVVPLGLFGGVLLAEFLKESCRELFETKANVSFSLVLYLFYHPILSKFDPHTILNIVSLFSLLEIS